MKGNKEIVKMLQKKGEELPIPESLHPKKLYPILQEYSQKKRRQKRRFYAILSVAACFCLIMGLCLLLSPYTFFRSEDMQQKALAKRPDLEMPSKEPMELALLESNYEEIYARLSKSWKALSSKQEATSYREFSVTEDMAASASKLSNAEASFGKTNTQVQGIEEADQIKNDGRYLYQIATKQTKDENGTNVSKTGIQILDTLDGVKEIAFLSEFESLEEFHLWEDLLITIENKTYDTPYSSFEAKKESVQEDLTFCDVLYQEQAYHEISIYQITDRSQPKKLKTFTLNGSYETSRILDGYFYGISRFLAKPGEGAQDYSAYVPSVDGTLLEASRIYCPPEADGNNYLVLVSIELANPTSLMDSRAVLAGAGTYYISPQNIYIAWYLPVFQETQVKEGSIKDRTKLLRFFYQKGHFYAQAEGEIPGQINNCFSMDEYKGNLRIVLTIQTYNVKEVIDERTGESIGFDYREDVRSNALYILTPSLSIKGLIEGLAENESIHSARFLGDTGYFVTFRQTDPLFAADLSDPEHPKILGELKVSGFSEYLHFYGEDRLLGIGMEVDEATGIQKGIKLSMFDISDPASLQEVARLHLENYYYSEALWDHRAVLIDTEKNLFGFEAEGSIDDKRRKDYLLFSYQEEAFIQTHTVNTLPEEESYYCHVRGTFIEDTLYLLYGNGEVSSIEL